MDTETHRKFRTAEKLNLRVKTEAESERDREQVRCRRREWTVTGQCLGWTDMDIPVASDGRAAWCQWGSSAWGPRPGGQRGPALIILLSPGCSLHFAVGKLQPQWKTG